MQMKCPSCGFNMTKYGHQWHCCNCNHKIIIPQEIKEAEVVSYPTVINHQYITDVLNVMSPGTLRAVALVAPQDKIQAIVIFRTMFNTRITDYLARSPKCYDAAIETYLASYSNEQHNDPHHLGLKNTKDIIELHLRGFINIDRKETA